MTNTQVKVFSLPGGDEMGSGVVVFDGYVVFHTDVRDFDLTMDGRLVSTTVIRGSEEVSVGGTLSVQEHPDGTRFVGVMLDQSDPGPVDPVGEDPGGEAARVDALNQLIEFWDNNPGIDDGSGDGDWPPFGPVRWVCEVVFRRRC